MALHTFYHTLHCSVTLHKTLSSSSHKLRQQCNNTRALTHNQLKFTAPRLVADSQQTQSLSRHVHYRRSEYTVCGISTSGNWNTYTSLCKARKLELTQLTFCAARTMSGCAALGNSFGVLQAHGAGCYCQRLHGTAVTRGVTNNDRRKSLPKHIIWFATGLPASPHTITLNSHRLRAVNLDPG